MEIRIENLALHVFLGAWEAERINAQYVSATISLEADVDKACKSDKLADTVDYHDLVCKIEDAVQGRDFRLVEALAATIAQCCLDFDKRISSADVTVRKELALLGKADCAAVRIKMPRKD